MKSEDVDRCPHCKGKHMLLATGMDQWMLTPGVPKPRSSQSHAVVFMLLPLYPGDRLVGETRSRIQCALEERAELLGGHVTEEFQTFFPRMDQLPESAKVIVRHLTVAATHSGDRMTMAAAVQYTSGFSDMG